MVRRDNRRMSRSATPTILALDTAGARCSVAVAHGTRVLVRRGAVGDTHLEHVLPMVDAVLRDAGLAVEDCAAFAFGAGPGSFTGVRVACTVVQGLCWAREKPAIPVGSLLALAVAADAGTPGRPGPSRVFCAIDARMGQAYSAVLEGGGLDWREVEPPFLCDLRDLPGRVAQARHQGLVGTQVVARARVEDPLLGRRHELARRRGGALGGGEAPPWRSSALGGSEAPPWRSPALGGGDQSGGHRRQHSRQLEVFGGQERRIGGDQAERDPHQVVGRARRQP